MKGRPKLADAAAPAGLALLAAWHWRAVIRSAVDVPYWDDWEFLAPDALPAGFRLSWFIERHNDSVNLPTRALTWLLHAAGGWSPAANQIVNFGLYLAVPALLLALLRRLAPGLPRWAAAAFAAFTLSPLAFENHSWAIQSCVHFQLAFLLACALLLFRAPLSGAMLAGGSACAWLSLNSYASGFPSVVVLLGAAALFHARRAGPAESRRAAAAALVLGAALGFWLGTYRPMEGAPPPAFPWSWEFWVFFANLAGLGFGGDRLSFTFGALCLALTLGPLPGLMKRGGAERSAAAALTLGLLGVLAATAFARAAASPDWAKNSRYAEFAMLLPALSAWCWWLRLEGDARRPRLIAGLWLFCALAYANNWSFSVYESVAAGRRDGQACLRSGAVSCPTLYPRPLGEKLAAARALSLGFGL